MQRSELSMQELKTEIGCIKNTISVVADDLGEAGYHHSTPVKKEPVRGGYVMPPEASSIDTLLSRSKALADQM